MGVLQSILMAVQVMAALGMIGLILVQHGKGADAGAAFGGGSSGSATLFGATGGANFLSRSTAVLATIFLASTLALAYFGHARPVSSGSVLEKVAPVVPGVPATETVPAAAVPAEKGAAQIPGQ